MVRSLALPKAIFGNKLNSENELNWLSDKVVSVLAENKIFSIEDLKNNEDYLSDLKGIGPKTIEKIKEKIVENEQA